MLDESFESPCKTIFPYVFWYLYHHPTKSKPKRPKHNIARSQLQNSRQKKQSISTYRKIKTNRYHTLKKKITQSHVPNNHPTPLGLHNNSPIIHQLIHLKSSAWDEIQAAKFQRPERPGLPRFARSAGRGPPLALLQKRLGKHEVKEFIFTSMRSRRVSVRVYSFYFVLMIFFIHHSFSFIIHVSFPIEHAIWIHLDPFGA